MNNTMIAIDVERLREMMDNGEPVTVLDVRPTDERQEWSIPGSVHVDAYRALNEGDPGALEGIDLPDDEPIVTVCAAGRTSLLAALHLREQGYDAWSLSGGMQS